MINILHIIDKLSMDGVNPSSCAVLMGDWFASMDSERFHMSVCTLRSPDPAGSYLEEMGIKVHYLGHGKISPANITGIAKLIESEPADIVHLHGYSAANFGRIAARLKGIPNIVHEHAVLKVQPHQYIADKLLARFTDVAIAVSGNVKEFMIHSRSIPQHKIRTIGNGIQLDKYRKVNETLKQKKRHELGIEDNVKIVGTVTRLREEKGNEYLIRALPMVLEQGPDFTLLIVGDGPLRGELERLVNDLGVESVVKFLGFRSDVPELLSVFDIQVIPSLTEGFPLCLAEAMAAENAIVASEVGGMKEIGSDGETVLFVPAKDPKSMAEKIIYLMNNADIATKLSEQAVRYSAIFSIENSVKRLQQTYEKYARRSH
jgi:glycosyltransferase involved in cell wall biosynthesis